MARILAFMVILLLAACGGGGGGTVGTDLPGGSDVAGDGPAADFGGVDFAGPDADARADTTDTAEPDGPPADALPWEPTPCESNEDCVDGFCLELEPGSGESVCAPTCLEECPGDWVCKLVQVDGPDPVSVCLPPGDALCRICQAHADCLLAGSLCIPGSGLFGACGKVCNPDAPQCPDDTECVLVEEDGLPLGWQCVPAAGSCCAAGDLVPCDDGNPCTAEGCDMGLGCQHEPVDGPCPGTDPCQTWTCVDGACVGTPVTEDGTLDGVDDDCDGLTDEDAYKYLQAMGLFCGGAVYTGGGGMTLHVSLGDPPLDGMQASAPDGTTLTLGVTALLGQSM